MNDFPPPVDDRKNTTALSVARLFSQRLDEVRKRHDEFSPVDKPEESDDEVEESKKNNRPTSFVSTIRRTPSVHRPELATSTAKAERVLGIGLPDPAITARTGENKASSRAAKWLRALGGKGSKGQAAAKHAAPARPMANSESRFSSSTASSSSDVRSQSLSAMLEESDDSGDDSGDEYNLPRSASSDPVQEPPRSVSSPVAAGDHIANDAAFDLQSPTSVSSHPSVLSSRRSASPRVSRAFSKRSSLVPGPALDLIEAEEQPPVPMLPAHLRTHAYDKALHVYAVQSLREYEQTVQEHDDFMNSQPEGERTAVPRLPVNVSNEPLAAIATVLTYTTSSSVARHVARRLSFAAILPCIIFASFSPAWACISDVPILQRTCRDDLHQDGSDWTRPPQLERAPRHSASRLKRLREPDRLSETRCRVRHLHYNASSSAEVWDIQLTPTRETNQQDARGSRYRYLLHWR